MMMCWFQILVVNDDVLVLGYQASEFMSYEEEDTLMSYEEEDTLMSWEEEDTARRRN